MTHIPVPPPDKGGWPVWRNKIEAKLADCVAMGNIDALAADNRGALNTYFEEQRRDALTLQATFKRKRAMVSQAPL